ncbi:MAG: acyl carrier protein [Candidatus Marinimicrobia bacterium]|jgi:acyl carrier protein|nr:acyl carrier protein [Candidatus Neomarinimicrobiota bacterium]
MAKVSFEQLKELVIDKLDVDESKVTKDASFIDDLGADSLDTVELIMSLEDEFDISIEDEAAEKLKTVGDALDYLEKNVE